MKRSLWVLIVLLIGFIGGILMPSIKEWELPKKWRAKPQQAFYPIIENKPFVIIVPSYNNSEWVKRNLESIFMQKYDNYRIIYVDDASTDSTLQQVEELVDLYQMHHYIEIVHNEKNKGACENIYRTVRSCDDDEIAIVLDGDDWFAHDRVLERLNEIYADPNVWLTYGSYIEYPSYGYTVANFAQPLPPEVIENNSIRDFSRIHWCLSQLRTYYVSLFKKIKLEDVQVDDRFFDATYDVAFMVPMIEMAATHVKYVKEIFMIYNRASPLNDNKVRAKRQQELAQRVFNSAQYSRLSSLEANGAHLCQN